MKFLKTPPFFILAIGLVFAQSAWAHPKDVEPSGAGPRPNAVRTYKTGPATLVWKSAFYSETFDPLKMPAIVCKER